MLPGWLLVGLDYLLHAAEGAMVAVAMLCRALLWHAVLWLCRLMLYCALTGQLIDKSVDAVKKHMKGKKFERAKGGALGFWGGGVRGGLRMGMRQV